jgi:SAM-dependent methyltransferase
VGLGRRIQLRELLLGIEGLALLRRMFAGDDEEARTRIREVRRLVGDDATFALSADAPELGVRDGYAAWAATYDKPGNPLIATEEPVVRTILDRMVPGRALDAACGTGRHTRRLLDGGHEVTGLDGSPEMLERARTRAPNAAFVLGDLHDLPVASGAFDLAVCALAFDHVRDIGRPIAELSRVVRRGGHVIVSDIHPVMTAIGGTAYFRDAHGGSAFMRNHGHVHSEYLDAFSAAGLTVVRCFEPRFGEEAVWAQGLGMAFVPEATRAAYYGLPGALVWELVRSSA